MNTHPVVILRDCLEESMGNHVLYGFELQPPEKSRPENGLLIWIKIYNLD